jgi:hypothetical protein
VEDSDSSIPTVITDATTTDTESQTDSTSSELTDEEFFQHIEDSEPPTDPTPRRSAPWAIVPPLVRAPVTTATITTATWQEMDKETLRKEPHAAWMKKYYPHIPT